MKAKQCNEGGNGAAAANEKLQLQTWPKQKEIQLNESAKMLATKLHQLQLIKPTLRLKLRRVCNVRNAHTPQTINSAAQQGAVALREGEGVEERQGRVATKRHKSLANNNFELTLTLAKRGRQQA